MQEKCVPMVIRDNAVSEEKSPWHEKDFAVGLPLLGIKPIFVTTHTVRKHSRCHANHPDVENHSYLSQ